MLDCQLYGLNPGGHHFTNVLLHTATAILLFLVLRRMTGALWRSAFVAAVFAIHPLRVESVAWVAERKDVLSGAVLHADHRGVCAICRKGDSGTWQVENQARRRTRFHAPRVWTLLWSGAAVFALGLMCKPMLVTLPLVLLLLDYWPLEPVAQLTVGRRTVLDLPVRRIPQRSAIS